MIDEHDVGTFTLRDVATMIAGRCGEEPWAIQVEAVQERLRRAAATARLRVRHPETLLVEDYAEWPEPSSGALVCTLDDVNAWLSLDGVPYRLTLPRAGNAEVHEHGSGPEPHAGATGRTAE